MRRLDLTLLCIVTLADLAYGATGSKPDLKKLTEGASLIVCGQIVAVHPVGNTTIVVGTEGVPATQMQASVMIGNVLKGDAKATTLDFKFDRPSVPIGRPGVSAGQYRLFFLLSTDSMLTLEDPSYPDLPCIPTTKYSSGESLERVAGTLLDIASSAMSPEQDRIMATDLLSDVQSVGIDSLRKLSTDGDAPTSVRASAAAALLQRNDTATLPVAQSMITQELSERLLYKIGSAIAAGIRDPKAIPNLTQMLRSAHEQIRRGSASALCHIGSTAAIPALIEALGDADAPVRYQAALGLGLLTAQYDWTPPMDKYLSNESYYLDHWRVWAQSWRTANPT